MKITNLFIALSIFSSPLYAEQEPTRYEDYQWKYIVLPAEFLNEVTRGIEFALKSGAARKICLDDLDHFHLLLDPKFQGQNINKAISERKGILFHTQEHVNYGPESYSKRNILVMKGTVKVVHPQKEYLHYPITVVPEDLGFQPEDFWSTCYIIDVARLHLSRWQWQNVITISSKKYYVGFAKGKPDDPKERGGRWFASIPRPFL